MKSLYLFICIGCINILYTQNTISGKVTDTDNNPLFGVVVYSPKTHIGTTTDVDGNYRIENLPNGEETIVFSFIGFKSVTRIISLPNKDMLLNIAMEESVFKMDEVILSIPFEKLQSENTMKVERQTVQQFKKQGSVTLAEGLALVPGVEQISTGSGIGKPVIRGLSGNRVLVYSQGVRLENQQFGSEHGLGLSDNGVESIEVIKGPASLLYGSDALGGVIYINPERYADKGQTKAAIKQIYFSNTRGSHSVFDIKSSGDILKFVSSMSYQSHLDYKIPTGKRVTNSRFNEFDFKGGLGFNLTNFSSDFRFNYTHSNLGIAEEVGEQSHLVQPQLPFQKLDNIMVSSHNHWFFKNSSLDFHFGYTSNLRKEFETPHHHEHEEDHHHGEESEPAEAALNMKLNTFSYDVKYLFPKINKTEFIAGIQGLFQTNKNHGEEILIPDAALSDFGTFVTTTTKVNNHQFQAGLRFDLRSIKTEEHHVIHHEHEDDHHEHHEHEFEAIDKNFQSFTASLGYKTRFFDIITTRVNLAAGFRAPNLAELTSNGVHHGSNRFEVGNSDLRTEKNWQLDAAIEYGNEHVEVFANGFYNAIANYIYLSPAGITMDEVPVYNYQQDNANLYGGEFGFHLHPHPLDWLHLNSSYEMVIGKQKNGDYLPLIPAHKLNATLRGDFKISEIIKNNYAFVKLENYFKQDRVGRFETDTKGYQLLNVGLGGDITLGGKKFNLTVNANNLLDTKYISHLSRLKENNVYNMGRNVIMGVQFYF
ncbi:MAG: TonB-dependent receptor [Flavobacteriales bacterium]|nr:MAG: TonB-dependent receptor [Flavobacteriales bacterium]